MGEGETLLGVAEVPLLLVGQQGREVGGGMDGCGGEQQRLRHQGEGLQMVDGLGGTDWI